MTIEMGNDEFILYIRKHNSSCKRTTDELGRKIWEWIRKNDPHAVQVGEDQPCLWSKSKGRFVSDSCLPRTATQFRFHRELLPKLYAYLDTL